jgi:hypothetical protein
MITAIVRLREALGTIALPFISDGRTRDLISSVTNQVEDYILPRLMQADAPLLAVVGGSTGAGKSTLVNSLVGRRVTEPGLLRPTTRSPVLVHHPADAAWFENARLLPDLERSNSASADHGKLQLVASDVLSPGLAILDAPDIDSVDAQNRALAAQLLSAADLWVFVTSAARYADQIPWEYLNEAATRSVSVAIVLDRTQPAAMNEVSTHLARMLTSRGLKDSPLFTVPESPLYDDGLLSAEIVAPIRAWLQDFAANAYLRQAIVDQTLQGSIRQLAKNSHLVADAARHQIESAAALEGALATTYEEAESIAVERLGRGELLRGEVLARWNDLVASGSLVRSLESPLGRLRDRMRGAARGAHADMVLEAIDEGIRLLLIDEAELTGLRVADVVATSGVDPASEAGRLGPASADFVSGAGRAVQAWQRALSASLTDEMKSGRTAAKLSQAEIPGLCVAVSVLVASAAAEQAESAAERDAAAARHMARQIAGTVLGADVLERVTQRAQDDLRSAVAEAFGGERRRAEAAVTRLGVLPEGVETLRQCARRIDDLRFAAMLPDEPVEGIR